MSQGLKARLTLINGKEFRWPDGTPIDRARAKYGKPFLTERGTQHVHTQGASYWTAERTAALAADNERRRKLKERGVK